MTRFMVYVPYIVTLAVRSVEAEDEDDALNKVEGHASLCASCATELDLSPDAQTLADFLGIELAPEPATPVGQRRRSPSGVEVSDWDVIA